MRHNTTLTATRGPGSRTLGATRIVIIIAVALGVAWAAFTYAQEAYLSHKLTQQASDLRHQNAVLAAQNKGYHKDIQAITSGAANEEEARRNGYSKPPEKLYLVAAPPTPMPATPSPSPHPSPTGTSP
jgi:cell division protein FtsB